MSSSRGSSGSSMIFHPPEPPAPRLKGLTRLRPRIEFAHAWRAAGLRWAWRVTAGPLTRGCAQPAPGGRLVDADNRLAVDVASADPALPRADSCQTRCHRRAPLPVDASVRSASAAAPPESGEAAAGCRRGIPCSLSVRNRYHRFSAAGASQPNIWGSSLSVHPLWAFNLMVRKPCAKPQGRPVRRKMLFKTVRHKRAVALFLGLRPHPAQPHRRPPESKRGRPKKENSADVQTGFSPDAKGGEFYFGIDILLLENAPPCRPATPPQAIAAVANTS